MLQIPELLAPAGDLERLRYAINYGADAVYCSLPEFGMRSAPANFTPEQLAEGSPYPKLQSNTSSYVQSDEDNNYLWNWVAPYYGGWENIPENIRNAYDTYTCTGLPAGPISNPGLAAIQAALDRKSVV